MLNNFRRFEFKFLLTEVQFNSILIDLMPYVTQDKNNIIQKPYRVRSLYYDNSKFDSAYEKFDGLLYRYKYRIRTYSFSKKNNNLFFLEKKGRYNNYVFKDRFSIPASEIYKLDNYFSIKNNTLINQFYKDRILRKLNPVVLIDYRRLAFYSKFSEEFRLTFDSMINVLDSNVMFPKNPRNISLFPNRVIMELKFTYNMPIWFYKLIEKYNLTRTSISKVCSGLQRLGYIYDEGQ